MSAVRAPAMVPPVDIPRLDPEGADRRAIEMIRYGAFPRDLLLQFSDQIVEDSPIRVTKWQIVHDHVIEGRSIHWIESAYRLKAGGARRILRQILDSWFEHEHRITDADIEANHRIAFAEGGARLQAARDAAGALNARAFSEGLLTAVYRALDAAHERLKGDPRSADICALIEEAMGIATNALGATPAGKTGDKP